MYDGLRAVWAGRTDGARGDGVEGEWQRDGYHSSQHKKLWHCCREMLIAIGIVNRSPAREYLSTVNCHKMKRMKSKTIK